MKVMRTKNLFPGALGILLLFLVSACYPDKIDYIEEFDLVGTNYDEEVFENGSPFLTFAVADTVIHLTGDDEDEKLLTREHDDFIIQKLREEMLALGYTEVTESEIADSIRPDVVLLPQALSTSYYQYIYYWYDYWGWYPGWGYWYPGWGYWYPGWGYPGYSYSYSTGTLIIDMMDTEVIDPENDAPTIVWTGLADGILTFNDASAQLRLDDLISQMFEQSTYLQK